LVAVGDVIAVVTNISDFVLVAVSLIRIIDFNTIIEWVADAIAVGVHPKFAGITHIILIEVGLIQIGHISAIIADVADPISISVGLLGVCDARTIVASIKDAIAIVIGVSVTDITCNATCVATTVCFVVKGVIGSLIGPSISGIIGVIACGSSRTVIGTSCKRQARHDRKGTRTCSEKRYGLHNFPFMRFS